MLSTLVNYANNSELENVLNTMKTKIVFKGVKKGHHLTIKDEKGFVLYSENVKKAGNLIKFFNFSNLKEGNYTLELEKDFEIIVKTFTIVENDVKFNAEAKKVIYKPVIRNVENKLLVSKVAFDSKPVDIFIYYKSEIIFSETVKNDEIINRIYRLDKKEKGLYTVVLKSNDRSFSNNFEI